MAKYRKKPVAIEAEVYREGLEDDFEFYSLTEQYFGYYTKEQLKHGYPKANSVPMIETSEGRIKISEDDCIIDYNTVGIWAYSQLIESVKYFV
ncbi:hypothetical protein EDM54_26135 [Brevibacillus borstelensis]|uniref:hypothetical protein n=1 Tax=Brevibacillus borstelensis TaxID=45462 RepID=UPI000F077B53|nr:hypothetical protein [Brevibacillus borstelensis]MED1885976.1 hypothetical protein [Brevibacillus borstelensis]RNB52788.1 hypothetical protein EDM54_26135 [Brevibacillus borstelensis]